MQAKTSQHADSHYIELAKEAHLEFVQQLEGRNDAKLLAVNEVPQYLKLQAIPLREQADKIVVATANPTEENQRAIASFWKRKQVELTVAPLQEINNVIGKRFLKPYSHDITYEIYDKDPIHSASYTFSLGEKVILSVLLIAFVFFLSFSFFRTLEIFNYYLATGTLIVIFYKCFLSLCALGYRKKIKGKDSQLPEVADQDLPFYTILIPLFHEKLETIDFLVNSLQDLDYPHEKMEIKLLLEVEDLGTQEIIKSLNLPFIFETIIVPPGLPKSKPRACNYGLKLAAGEYLVIYDAEDLPDRDQLRKAVAKFRSESKDVVCLQAGLNFYNYRENWLTRLFTIEYTHWFDQLIPGLSSLNAPIPLGGTSNHFKVAFLREVGGWDPFIGTEDADIGMRIFRHGYKTKYLESTTYEEANTKFVNWFRQRTRWNKGYYQTFLVNIRDPINAIKQLGMKGFLHFLLFVGGNVFIQTANLWLWLFFITILFLPSSIVNSFFSPTLVKLSFLNFFGSNVLLLVMQFIATWNRGLKKLAFFVPLKLIYWMLMSLAGYFALFDLLVRPGYWYKTEHGISKFTTAKRVERI